MIVTKRTDPGSQALRASLPGSLQALSIKGLVLAEMDTETFGDRVARIGITEFPTVLVYGRGDPDRGLTLMGHLSKPGGANAVAAWVGKLRPAVAAQPADPAVVRTNHYPCDQQAPSPQAPPVAPAPSAARDLRGAAGRAGDPGLYRPGAATRDGVATGGPGRGPAANADDRDGTLAPAQYRLHRAHGGRAGSDGSCPSRSAEPTFPGSGSDSGGACSDSGGARCFRSGGGAHGLRPGSGGARCFRSGGGAHGLRPSGGGAGDGSHRDGPRRRGAGGRDRDSDCPIAA